MIAFALALMMQASAASIEGAAERIAGSPELARMFEQKSAPFIRCGRKALEKHLAEQAAGTSFESMSQSRALGVFQKAMDGAARDCDIDGQATIIAADIRAALPDIDRSAAVAIARANLYQLIGLSIWGNEP